MVERSLSMREVPGSMPGFSNFIIFFPFMQYYYFFVVVVYNDEGGGVIHYYIRLMSGQYEASWSEIEDAASAKTKNKTVAMTTKKIFKKYRA